MMDDDDAKTVRELVDRIRPILAGHHVGIQAAVLADLLALWLVGWAPQKRMQALKTHLDVVWPLVKMNDKIMYGERGHPSLNA